MSNLLSLKNISPQTDISDAWDIILARPGQKLSQHMNAVSALAAQFGKKCGVEEMSRLAGFFHDLGKISADFQSILDESVPRGSVKVPHSIFGAKRLFADISSKATTPILRAVAEMMGNVIAAHHTSLHDNISPDGETPLMERLEKAQLFPLPPGSPEISPEKLSAEFDAFFSKARGGHSAFAISMLIKLVYSCLVDADRYDAFLHESGEEQPACLPDWEGLLSNLTNYLSCFSSESEISAFRTRISDECGESGLRERGVYKLEVSTGGGKTLASLRFALVHAGKHKLDRIIFVIPYLSILEQTAKEIRKALGADDVTVLEHHSGFLPDERVYDKYKLQTDRWDAPIILTTQVQFLESVFSAKGSDLRKLHNMANSVIIFDEAQSLPVECVHLFNGAIDFLYRICGATVLLCTATQPLLDKVERKLSFTQNPSIARNGTYKRRTSIENKITPKGYTPAELAAFVKEKHALSTLIIVNTKAAAKSLYDELKDGESDVLHLSTNMCAAHRSDVINSLRDKLETKEPVICVSTQLIEAGVDISFECVIRDVAGLDSIFQAAGRCNRHGEFDEVKNVYVVNIAGENLSRLPDIKKGSEITQWLFSEGREDDITEYYRRYFYARSGDMDYPIPDGGTIYDLLSSNIQGCNAYKNRGDKEPPAMRSAPRSASDAFFVIGSGRKDIIVPYKNALEPYESALELVQLYRKAYSPREKRGLLRRLGKYSVSLYRYQFEALEAAGALYPEGLNKELIMLSDGFYDSVRGVDLEGQHQFLYS